MDSHWWQAIRAMWDRKQIPIAILALVAIAIHLVLRWSTIAPPHFVHYPLFAALALGGVPLVIDLVVKLVRREFGSDLLAGISIVTAVLLGEYLAGTLVVLMLSGGEAIEALAVERASFVLKALADRMPASAHRKTASGLEEIDLRDIRIGDEVVVFPHEACPVDGVIVEGHGAMDESYLTGEPYNMSKTPGCSVLSGAMNGATALTIRAEKLPEDSRYAKIMQVMRESEQNRPRMRRLGDQLGAYYTPIAVTIAVLAWLLSGDATRFLAVLVVATPCPLLIAIPVAVIGAVSLSARRGIIVRNPAALEQLDQCRTVIFDKTGTLTYGRPQLTDQIVADTRAADDVLRVVASLERYSKHPLAGAVLDAAEARNLSLVDAESISEKPGEGLSGRVLGQQVLVTHRRALKELIPGTDGALPPAEAGLECVIAIDGEYAATYRFRDKPRQDGANFVHHLEPKHAFDRVMLVSGDRESEVRFLAEQVGIREVHFSQSPEQKLAIVRDAMQNAKTMFLGDGINDAPALMAASVGIAMGPNSDVIIEAADAVILDSTVQKVDELFHIGRRMRAIALQSAVGGMAASVLGMLLAAAGYLPPVAGAVAQEIIDVVVVLNAVRVAIPPATLVDYEVQSSAGTHERPVTTA